MAIKEERGERGEKTVGKKENNDGGIESVRVEKDGRGKGKEIKRMIERQERR